MPAGTPGLIRGGTAITDALVLLNDRLGVHSALAPLKDLWTAGKMAVVENVGYPNPSLSHFQSMDIWETMGQHLEPIAKRSRRVLDRGGVLGAGRLGHLGGG